jgi:hypothetical protein
MAMRCLAGEYFEFLLIVKYTNSAELSASCRRPEPEARISEAAAKIANFRFKKGVTA